MANIDKYSYDELRAKAIAHNATKTDVDRLGEWFELYGAAFWNGEYYDADGYRVYPIITWDDDAGQGDVTGYEIRK